MLDWGFDDGSIGRCPAAQRRVTTVQYEEERKWLHEYMEERFGERPPSTTNQATDSTLTQASSRPNRNARVSANRGPYEGSGRCATSSRFERQLPSVAAFEHAREHVVRRADQGEGGLLRDRRRHGSKVEARVCWSLAQARLGGFSERRLSDFVTGWAQPREAEQRVLAELLNTTVKHRSGRSMSVVMESSRDWPLNATVPALVDGVVAARGWLPAGRRWAEVAGRKIDHHHAWGHRAPPDKRR